MQPALLAALLNYPKLLISITRRSLYPQEKVEASPPLHSLWRHLPTAWSQPLPLVSTDGKVHPESVGSPTFFVIESWQSRP